MQRRCPLGWIRFQELASAAGLHCGQHGSVLRVSPGQQGGSGVEVLFSHVTHAEIVSGMAFRFGLFNRCRWSCHSFWGPRFQTGGA